MKHRIFALLCCTSALVGSPASDATISVSTQTVIDIPIFHHIFTYADERNRYVEFADESRWKIPEQDLYQTRYWIPGQIVVITPNNRWFSDYNYSLTNQANGYSVSANLLRGPLHTSGFAHHVSGMDQNTRGKKTIILDGNTYWSISEEQHHIVDGWQVNDTVIIGYNDAWFTSFDRILINVETNTFAKARRI